MTSGCHGAHRHAARWAGQRHLVTGEWGRYGGRVLSTSYLLDQGAEMKRREGRLLGRLHYDGVTAAERGRQLPRQHQEGEVPLQQSTGRRGGPGAARRPVLAPTHAPREDAGFAVG